MLYDAKGLIIMVEEDAPSLDIFDCVPLSIITASNFDSKKDITVSQQNVRKN
jgi:hypothetical protein